MLKILVLVSNLLGLIYGATIPGQCDNNLPMQTFSANDFQGQWYLIEVSSSPPASCMKFNAVFNNNRFDVTRSQVSQQTLQSTNQVAEPDPSGRGILSVYETSSTNQETTPVWILTTDYTNYALLYTCRNVDTTNMEVTSWKMSKSNALTSAAAAAINSHIQTIASLSTITFQQVDQSATACFHLPAIAPGADVVLPGQCDPNFAAVPNFDAQRYAGRWRLIESYHSRFQSGACNEALYTPNTDGSIAIVNSMVEDRTLMTRAGTARLSEGDTSGRLNVFIGSETNPTPLWILGTDYESFALAYSCSNVGTDERRVTAWKLSRENTLSPTANTQINQIMAGIDVLDQRYFTAVDRSAAACFHLPAIAPGADVVLPGQCNPDLVGVPNFDPQRYAGRWRLIESYHSRFQSGACNEARYAPNEDGSIAIMNSMIVDQSMVVRLGVARISADDNSGELAVFIGSETDPTPLWILDTDYESYALAYSCENVDDKQRRVTAWKLSRANTLSPTANTQINQVMAGIDVLDQRYFTAVDRSAAACFYYPEEMGERIVLPGQCDLQIPVQKEFDMSAFSGTWYQMERYPYPEVSAESSCIASRLTYDAAEGAVSISNWEVNDGQLNTIEGQATVDAATASLEVTIDESKAKLQVLKTDYSAYALLYTCVNVDEEHRAVVAFKLSRGRTMKEESSAAINEYMAHPDRVELHQPLFIQVEQSEDCPEPSSSYIIKSSIMVLLMSYFIHLFV